MASAGFLCLAAALALCLYGIPHSQSASAAARQRKPADATGQS